MWIQIREDPELLGQIGSGSVILFQDLDLVPDLTSDERECITLQQYGLRTSTFKHFSGKLYRKNLLKN